MRADSSQPRGGREGAENHSWRVIKGSECLGPKPPAHFRPAGTVLRASHCSAKCHAKGKWPWTRTIAGKRPPCVYAELEIEAARDATQSNATVMQSLENVA